MEEHEEVMKNRKDKILNWLKNPLNSSLVAVLLFAAGIRLYYFFLLGNQPLWWDEACYGSLAKNLLTHQWDGTELIIGETLIRPILFPVMWAALLFLKIPESVIRFTLELIPSILSVFFVYLIGKETFGKRVGIISAFIFSVLWIHLFYSVRLLTNVPAMVFLLASIYLFMKATKKELNLPLFSVSLILLSISTLIRYPNGIVFIVFFIILILNKNLYLNKRKFWYAGIIGIAPILIFFLINFLLFGNIFPALLGGEYLNVSGGEKVINPIAWDLLNFNLTFLQKYFFTFFLIGGIILISKFILGYNFILKNKKLRNYLLLTLVFIAMYGFFIFYLRSAEDRYFIPISFIMVTFAAFGIDETYKFLKKYHKSIAIVLLLGLLVFGAQAQLKQADGLIKNRAQSFLQIRQGFEWLGANAPEGSTIIGRGIEPYAVYYAEQNYIDLPRNESDYLIIEEADYAVIHAFTNQDEYYQEYLQNNPDKWNPIQVYFFDQQQTQPALVIYQRN